jgi:hypothetical protein
MSIRWRWQHDRRWSFCGAQVPGNLEAIREWKLLVLAEKPFRRGTEVIIDAKGNILNGIVELCNFDEPLVCYIQVRLKPESRWSKQRFEPEHLLALNLHPVIASKKCA